MTPTFPEMIDHAIRDEITPAAADADAILGPLRGHTSTSGAIERDRTPEVGVCLSNYGHELGLTVGGDDGPLAVEASAYLDADDARELAARLNAAADELEEDGHQEESSNPERFDAIRSELDDHHAEAVALVDALEKGEADIDDFDSYVQSRACAYVPVEEAADAAGVIDAAAPQYTAVNEARAAIHRLAFGDTTGAIDRLSKATAFAKADRDGLDAEAAREHADAATGSDE